VFADFQATKATTKQAQKRSLLPESSERTGSDAKNSVSRISVKHGRGHLVVEKPIKQFFCLHFNPCYRKTKCRWLQLNAQDKKKILRNCFARCHPAKSPNINAKNVNELYKTEKQKLISELQKVKYISRTADLWSSYNRGFLGMTVHYVDSLTLDRVSHTLVCRRFEHTRTGHRIAQIIAQVLKEFGITDKVVNFVNDNAANMVKAFNLLPDLCHETDIFEGKADEASANVVANDVGVAQASEATMTRELTWDEAEIDAGQDDDGRNIDPEESTVKMLLLEHKRCANHTLNLVAAVNSLKARENVRCKKVYDGAMAKVQASGP
jgi:predicted Fe-S protein YdhL (DUF1289 family)